MKTHSKFNKRLVSFALCAMPAMASLVGCYGYGRLSAKYVVTAKDDEKIVYRVLSCPYHLHDRDAERIMTFYQDSKLKHGGFFKYINVGDTITGDDFELEKNRCESHMYFVVGGYQSTIRTLNGKKMRVLQHRIHRDSIDSFVNHRHR